MYYLYILTSENENFYTGTTNNLERRFEEHTSKASKYTKRFDNLKLVYTEEYSKRSDAEKRELQIKGWSKAKKVALINQDYSLLSSLS